MNISKRLLIITSDFFLGVQSYYAMFCDLFKFTLLLCKKYSCFAQLKDFTFQKYPSCPSLSSPFSHRAAQRMIQYGAKP